jgi:hypothetical protein
MVPIQPAHFQKKKINQELKQAQPPRAKKNENVRFGEFSHVSF